MMIIASLVPNFLMGLIVGAGYVGVMMVTSGYFRVSPHLPKVSWRYPILYINFGAWGLQGAYKNDMIGLEFEAMNPCEPKLKGENILRTMLGIEVDHSKWWDLAAVATILISFRLFLSSFSSSSESSLRLGFINSTRNELLHRIKKRPSFRKAAASLSFPSKRHHQPLHPLSSQVGLTSPIH
ncbi:hypothetical protein QN277_016491 [Acacia crassicarpa]|uniref:Uncharacterized protein n=1 Tax=Acacia crassicarpa TaxID=499986 RepID=A0AAE1TC88_9FABA|nr:hypothetical protein QN277_016491 [Acacia crassicarpa]